jgi:8-oxo-dGTP pyrophosphatase MutT (NUDIX family)
MKNVINVVECAIEFEGQFLIIQRPSGVHAGGLLAFVGGKVEEQDYIEGQDILKNAAKREVLEEVGIVLKCDLSYVTTSYFINEENNIPNIDTIFHAVLKTKPQVIASPREVPKYFWLTAPEIMRHENSPVWLKRYINLITPK